MSRNTEPEQGPLTISQNEEKLNHIIQEINEMKNMLESIRMDRGLRAKATGAIKSVRTIISATKDIIAIVNFLLFLVIIAACIYLFLSLKNKLALLSL